MIKKLFLPASIYLQENYKTCFKLFMLTSFYCFIRRKKEKEKIAFTNSLNSVKYFRILVLQYLDLDSDFYLFAKSMKRGLFS